MKVRAVQIALALCLASAPAGASTLHEPLIGLSLEERYDQDTLSGGGDLMSKVSPELGYRLREETVRLLGRYALDLTHHLEDGGFTTDHRAALEYRQMLSRRLILRAEGQFYRVEDTTTLPRFGVARIGAAALWQRSELAGVYRVSRRDSLELGYANELSRLFVNRLPLGFDHEPYLRYSRALTRRLDASLAYRLQLFTSDLSLNSSAQSTTARLRYEVTRHGFAALEAGPLLFTPLDGGSTWGGRGTAELGYEARGLWLGLVAGRDLVGAAGYATSVWADFLQGYASWRLARRFTVSAGGGVFRNSRAQDGHLVAQGYGASAGTEWRITRSLGLHFGVDQLGQIDVSGGALDLSRTIVSARVSYLTP